MFRCLPLCLLVCVLTAADGGLFGPHDATNTATMRFLRSYALNNALEMEVFGDDHFRLATIGSIDLRKPDHLLEIGRRCLVQLERWTGNPRVFLPEAVDEERCLYLVVVPDRQFDRILNEARERRITGRPQNADLQRSLRTFNGDRVQVISDQRFFQQRAYIPSHWTARFCSDLALGTWMRSWQRQVEPWLLQGTGSELERLFADRKQPLILTIEYEQHDSFGAQRGDWAGGVKLLIKQRSDKLLTADAIMGLDFIARSYPDYWQMWSLCQFIRAASNVASKRGQNRYQELLLCMARDGQTGLQALETVFDLDTRTLTLSWRKWALRQH